MDFNKKAIALHKKHHGKIEIKTKVSLKTKDDLSTAYTPGVAAVCLEIAKDKKKSWELTNRANTVAIVTDGTAILGLGNIGPEAGMPVMEGKSAIFKAFAGIDAYPLAINTTEVDEIVKFCKYIEPSVAGINLEDIAAPRCFDVLSKLEQELSIPVFHDDQDGTAIVALAALINACRVTGKVLKEQTVVINGAGAAGIAIARLLIAQGIKDIVLVDSKGVVHSKRPDLNSYKKEIASRTNPRDIRGSLTDALSGADVFIGVSKGGVLTKEMVALMSDGPIILAMANPDPEILPGEAWTAGASIVGTGRSDFPNQVNNALVFPGLFKGLLRGKLTRVTTEMKTSAAIAIAYTLKKPKKDNILPKVTDKKVVEAVAKAVMGKRRNLTNIKK